MSRERPSEAVIADLVHGIFPASVPLRIDPVHDGVSTFVYRIQRARDVFYLRVLPEVGADFAPEAAAHRQASSLGARVPEVIFFTDNHPLVSRSVMLTTAIPGAPIGHAMLGVETLRAIVRAAGRDLARINQVPVDGFGWIRRDPAVSGRLVGEHPTERAFIHATLDEVLPVLDRLGLSVDAEHLLLTLAERLPNEAAAQQAWLAHGDFDASHIYQDHGHYSGIIDFGEIRGTNRWYDLAHFRLHDGEAIRHTTPALAVGRLWSGDNAPDGSEPTARSGRSSDFAPNAGAECDVWISDAVRPSRAAAQRDPTSAA